jgi:hypothetical protein
MGGARGIIAEVASGQAKDGWIDATGCIRPCYSSFVIFNVLDSRGIVVI